MEPTLQILGTIAGLIGFFTVTFRLRIGWYITYLSCIVTIPWCVIIDDKSYGFMVMQIVYAILCIRGLINWKKN